MSQCTRLAGADIGKRFPGTIDRQTGDAVGYVFWLRLERLRNPQCTPSPRACEGLGDMEYCVTIAVGSAACALYTYVCMYQDGGRCEARGEESLLSIGGATLYHGAHNDTFQYSLELPCSFLPAGRPLWAYGLVGLLCVSVWNRRNHVTRCPLLASLLDPSRQVCRVEHKYIHGMWPYRS